MPTDLSEATPILVGSLARKSNRHDQVEVEASEEMLAPAVIRPTYMLDQWQQWADKCAYVRQPVTEVLAALVTFSAIMGQGYRGPTRAVAPLIALVLSPAGGGKEPSQRMAQEFMKACDMSERLCAAKWASSSGLEGELEQCEERLAISDEFADFIEMVCHPNCPAYRKDIMTLIKTCYGGDEWRGSVVKDLAQTRVAKHPRLAILASAQPVPFWNKLGPSAISDGFMSRILVMTGWSNAGSRDTRSIGGYADTVPPAMVDFVKEAVVQSSTLHKVFDSNPKTRVAKPEYLIPFKDKAAHEAFLEIKDAYYEEWLALHRAREVFAPALIARSAERMIRLAAVYAWSERPRDISVSREAIEWAKILVDNSDRCVRAAMIDTADKDNANVRMQNQYRRLIANAGDDGITDGKLQNRTRFGMQAHLNVIKQLVASKAIRVTRGPKGGQHYHWSGMEVQEDAASDQEDL